MPPKLTAQEAQAKHARNLKAAVNDIAAGVNRVTVAPGVQAAAKAEKMRANLNAAIDSGKWQRRTASVPLADWQKAMTTKGVQRVGTGIDAAAGKTTEFFSQLFDYQTGLMSEVGKMPDMTLEDSVQRAGAWIRGMSKFQRK
jgi:ElaB/YqjD/DUF883 family membrane-anchored ribosome-binding protein